MENKEKKYFYNPLKTRTIICSSAIDEEVADRILKEFLMLEQESHQPIRLIINSPGGQVNSGMAIYDFMQLIQSPVHTIVAGLAASMGSKILFVFTFIFCYLKQDILYSLCIFFYDKIHTQYFKSFQTFFCCSYCFSAASRLSTMGVYKRYSSKFDRCLRWSASTRI